MRESEGFAARHGLYTDEQSQLAKEIAGRLRGDGTEVVRFSFPDQHGVLRGKVLGVDEAIRALVHGCSITSTLLLKDTSHRSVFPVFSAGGGLGLRELQGGADLVMVADPATFRILPWAEGNAFHRRRPVEGERRGSRLFRSPSSTISFSKP